MSRELTCLACGHTGTDVAPTVVEYPDPLPVEVPVAVAWDQHANVMGNEIRTVPGRYGAEWRCNDHVACRGRVLEQERPPEPDPARAIAGPTDEEAMSLL